VKISADADRARWVPVTGSFGFGGRRARKKAIRMLLTQANASLSATGRPGSALAAWAMSQAAPLLMRKADGRALVWVWKDDPELLVVLAQVQQVTPQLRAARAMMPIEYDDTESFRGTYLGVGEKLAMPLPPTRPDGASAPPFATYTWDTGTHFVTVTAVCSDRERFGTVLGAVDDLARSVRLIEDVTVQGSSPTLRLDPS